MKPERLVCWFSCGATSAVATKRALDKCRGSIPIEIVYCDTGSEHPDNRRFLDDCEAWFSHPIRILKSPKYTDIWDVFEKTRWLVGPNGARCTVELKKMVRHNFERVWSDLQVFGFDALEQKRVDRFAENNPEITTWLPLVEAGTTKKECLETLQRAGIELPMMYRLGYRNANCVGCVKGQQGYWNKIRRDFPSVFERMAKVERQLDVAVNKRYEQGDRIRLFLDELDPGAGRYTEEPAVECGVLCQLPLFSQ